MMPKARLATIGAIFLVPATTWAQDKAADKQVQQGASVAAYADMRDLRSGMDAARQPKAAPQSLDALPEDIDGLIQWTMLQADRENSREIRDLMRDMQGLLRRKAELREQMQAVASAESRIEIDQRKEYDRLHFQGALAPTTGFADYQRTTPYAGSRSQWVRSLPKLCPAGPRRADCLAAQFRLRADALARMRR